jgi:DNA-binding GntR family transcriptional regulator
LRDLAVSTRGRLAPYRGAQLEAPARLAMSWAEHDAIVNAILRANGPLAAELMRAHLSETQSTVRDLESLGLGKAGGDHAAG